ncbi:unnamed protein product [Xylocopa violacea]|uniref:Uncharacterized protein n=1 Tax=Xylocopa violacea TaxID=135666 RepID=A0ABP1NM23_XYLVO
MPACEPWCPLVKAQLKKIATEAPWILKKVGKERDAASDIEDERYVSAISDAVSDIEDEKFVSAIPDAVSDIKDKKFVSAIPDAKRDDDEKVVEDPKIFGIGYRRFPKDASARPLHSIEPTMDTTKDVMKSQLTMVSDDKTETATQWSISLEDSGQLETDATEETAKYMGDPESEKKKAIKKVGKDEREDIAMSRDECDSTCPRRIPRKTRIRKLEERQRIVDSYLLNKGTGYFEDVCTCSLACVVRALSHDSFVRSILTSAIVFTLGLKLCSELDAWYLPVRL